MLWALPVGPRGPTTPVYTCRFSVAFRVRRSLPLDASRPPEGSIKTPADVRRGPFWQASPGQHVTSPDRAGRRIRRISSTTEGQSSTGSTTVPARSPDCCKGTEAVQQSCRPSFLEQFRMRTRAHEDDGADSQPIDQQKVAADVAFPVISPVSLQRMIEPLAAQKANHWR